MLGRACGWAECPAGYLDFVRDDRLAPLFELMAFAGVRRSGALGLRWRDVDVERRRITVVQQLVDVGKGAPVFGPPKTRSGEHRTVALAEPAVGSLLAHRLAQDAERAEWGTAYVDHDLVFARPGGEPLSPERVTKTFARLVEKSGLRKVRLHDLRHGTMSLWAAAGIPLEIASKMAGHSSYAFSADRYQHLFAQTAIDAADAAWSLVPRTGVPTSFPQGAEDGDGLSPMEEKGQVRRGAPVDLRLTGDRPTPVDL
jgi:integrase